MAFILSILGMVLVGAAFGFGFGYVQRFVKRSPGYGG